MTILKPLFPLFIVTLSHLRLRPVVSGEGGLYSLLFDSLLFEAVPFSWPIHTTSVSVVTCLKLHWYVPDQYVHEAA